MRAFEFWLPDLNARLADSLFLGWVDLSDASCNRMLVNYCMDDGLVKPSGHF
jgi:hypothetical protein